MRPYFRQVAGLLAVGSVSGILMNTCVVLPALLLGHAVDVVAAFGRDDATRSAVGWAALLLAGGTVATELPRVGKRWWLGVCKSRIIANIRVDALRGVLSWPAERLHTTSVGDVMARIVGDVDVLGTGLGELMVETWDTLLFSVSLAVAMLVIDPGLGLWALAPVPVALVLAKVVGQRIARQTLRARQANSALTNFVLEGLSGLRVLRMSGRGAAYTERLGTLAQAQATAELAAIRLTSMLAPIYTTVTTAGIVVVIWLGGERVSVGSLTVGDLVAFLVLFARFTGRAFRIPQMANRVQAAVAAWSRLEPLLASPPPLTGEPRRASFRSQRICGLSERPRVQPVTPTTGPADIQVVDVTFSYPGGSDAALNDLSLDIAAGSFVVITGPVGAGKSALARILMGLYPVQSGSVRVAGGDPHSWTAADRATTGYLPQGHPVFSGTISENVLFGDPAADPPNGAGMLATERIDEAVQIVGLVDDVAAMPAGTSTVIGELGARISGGQRQRVALARAIAGPAAPAPRLLVLDDPFSAVDTETELHITAALSHAFGPGAPPEKRATIVLFSSRLAGFAQADGVFVLDAGRVVERGPHAELLQQGGLYARIFHAQRHTTEPPP